MTIRQINLQTGEETTREYGQLETRVAHLENLTSNMASDVKAIGKVCVLGARRL